MLKGVVCPKCHGELSLNGDLVSCYCGRMYHKDNHGYINFFTMENFAKEDLTSNEYAETQDVNGLRLFREYIKPLLLQKSSYKVLDVGCGVGAGIVELNGEGYEAYGIDLPYISSRWAKRSRPKDFFFLANALELPFPNNYFDFLYSTGVIEHVGTFCGDCTLKPNYFEERQRYADELLRVIKRGGRILISCPNKRFPFDLQHVPYDVFNRGHPLRELIWQKTKINVHQVWGEYHLLSYPEVRHLFQVAESITPLSLQKYFGTNSVNNLLSRIFIETYVNLMPKRLLGTFINPYMCVLIKK